MYAYIQISLYRAMEDSAMDSYVINNWRDFGSVT